MSFLEIFLSANAFLLGVVLTLAVQYFLAHKHSQKTAAKGSSAAPIPPAVRERIAKQAEANFQGIVNRSALQLQHDLGATGTQLNKLLEKFGSDIRANTQGALSGAQDQISEQQTAILKSLATRQAELDARMSQRQTELEAELEQSFATQKDDLTKRLNEKLNDAVLAFLLETLGHEVDLGAQADYLVATLEANKAELIATTAGGPPSSPPEAKQ
jgi:hypothetical protein